MPSLPTAPSGPTPIDPFERRDQWRFAVLLVALFSADAGRADAHPAASSPSAPATRAAATGTSRRRAGRLVRPPRSC